MFTAQTATKYPYAGLVDLPVEIILQIVTYISPPNRNPDWEKYSDLHLLSLPMQHWNPLGLALFTQTVGPETVKFLLDNEAHFEMGPESLLNSVLAHMSYCKVPQLNWKVPVKLPLFECHTKARVLLTKHQRHDNCHCIPSFDSLNPVDPESTLDSHITDIFGLAATPRAVLSASGSSTLHVHNTADPAIPITQSISGAHKLGCHHICTSRDGRVAASAGFAGELKVWVVDKDTGEWKLHSEVTDQNSKAGETWAIALSEDGKFLAGTTYDGRINVWDIGEEGTPKIREYETGSPGSGSFGMSVDLSRDGKFTASGHQNGSVYLFNNDTGRLASSLPGLAKPVRAVAFSPGNTRLAAAGDSSIIAIYDLKHGEQVGNLTGHSSWITSIDWSDTGEYLLSGAMDGKVKVWSVERYACVATHSETDKALWSVKWLPKTGRSEMFCTAGANRSISFYREATGA
ncbi:Meiotic recombination protein rec14 [Colletotrichum sp. SAR 10_75]|nr:Meiotic recombination protein rec14 [Colletotrichum sp. SAR 10_75]